MKRLEELAEKARSEGQEVEDTDAETIVHRGVVEKQILVATYKSELADCAAVDGQCDYAKQNLANMRTG